MAVEGAMVKEVARVMAMAVAVTPKMAEAVMTVAVATAAAVGCR